MYISITTIVLIAIILILIGVVAILLLKPKKTQIIERETKVIIKETIPEQNNFNSNSFTQSSFKSIPTENKNVQKVIEKSNPKPELIMPKKTLSIPNIKTLKDGHS